jgi:hypothetical protein
VKRLLRTSVTTLVAAGAAVALAVSGAQAAATPGWRIVATFKQADAMTGVSASDAANAWAVAESGGCCDLLAAHWNGKKWETINTFGIGGGFTSEVIGASVAAIPNGRAMIFVTSTDEETDAVWVDAFEWKGRSWAEHQFPDLPGDVIASGLYDVWGFDSGTPMAEHLSGSTWTQVSIPLVVSQASGNAAAGDWITGTVAAKPKVVELMHWSNGAWRNAVLPKIAVPAGDQMLPGIVAAATTTDIWLTVGVGRSTGTGLITTYLLHWNGKAWSKVVVPRVLTLSALASDGHGGAWATSDKYMWHYAGGHWARVPAFAARWQGNLQLIPGTRSVLGVANGDNVLKYGP